MDNDGDVKVPGFNPISGKLGERKSAIHSFVQKPKVPKIHFKEKDHFGDDLFEQGTKRLKHNLTLVTESSKSIGKSPNISPTMRNSKAMKSYHKSNDSSPNRT